MDYNPLENENSARESQHESGFKNKV